jgi:predicted Zn-dependent protease
VGADDAGPLEVVKATANALRNGIRFHVLSAAAALALLAGCASQQQVMVWRIDGRTDYARVDFPDKSGKVFASLAGADINRVVDAKERVEAAAGRTHAQLYFAEAKQPNAFASYRNSTPTITITLPMVTLLGSDSDAMAALCGHELAHLYRGHGSNRAAREQTRAGVSTVVGTAANYVIPFSGLLVDVGSRAVTTMYDRDEEREADADGIRYAARAGFDPYGAVRLQEKLLAASGDSSIPFLSTHPSGPERIDNMMKLAAQYGAKPPPVKSGSQ